MPIAEVNGAAISYEEYGSGVPVLLIAPGGMKSAASFWTQTPWNPIEALRDDFRVIAMDQRNAGESRAPVTGTDGWHTYVADQLALMSHLGIDQFHAIGMCIGGPYCLGLIEQAPARILSATLFQSIGRDNNDDVFYDMFDNWAGPLSESLGDADPGTEAWQAFRENMYGGNKVLFNVDEAFVRACTTPLLVLMGDDVYHPQSTSRMIATTAPNATFVEAWKSGDAMEQARQTCHQFLKQHS